MRGLDINAKPDIINVLYLPRATIMRMNPFKDESNRYWRSFDIYSKYVREGSRARDKLCIDEELIGRVDLAERWFYNKMKWCIAREITIESDPEYYI